MTKVSSTFFSLCVVLWTSTKNSLCADSATPYKTYKKWLSIKTTLESVEHSLNCTATPEQMLGWIYLQKLFNEKEAYGIMRFAWPRLSFYSKRLAPLVDSPVSDLNICNFRIGYHSTMTVCFENKCTSCTDIDYYDGEPDSSKTADGLTSLICDNEYANPDEAEIDKERQNDSTTLWAPPVTSPGPLTLEEVNSWIQTKLQDKKNVAEKEGDNCDAPPELSMSLSYLRSLAEKPDVAKELQDFQKFYAEKLKWLKGADKEIISCGGPWPLFCGWDAVCVYCEGSSLEASEELAEACEPKSHWIYKKPREPYKVWVQNFLSLKQRSVDSKKEDKTCNADEWRSESWFYLMELFQCHQKGGVMKWAWPRLSFYEERLSEALTSNADVLCEFDVTNKDDILLCDDGKCKKCTELDFVEKYKDDDSFFKRLCEGTHEKSQDEEVNKVEVKDWKDLVLPVVEPKGELTLEEALSWNATLGITATAEKWGDCDIHPKLTLSQKYLLIRLMKLKEEGAKEAWRWKTKDEVKAEMEQNQKTYDEKLRWLKGAEKSREFCGDDLVCSPDGVCVPCGAATDKVEELKEACGLQIELILQVLSSTEAENGGESTGKRKWGALIVFAAILGLLQL